MDTHEKKTKDKSISSALGWKLLERFGVQFGVFVLEIVLARILDPSHYGVLSMMVIFTNLANVFIQRGFNTSLVQNKDVTEEDYSSVFWVTTAVATILYAGLFASAPIIAEFYKMPELVQPFRVLCLILFPGALNSIQVAKISRGMDFKKVFYSNLAAIVISGAIGIVAALLGAGLWALVLQKLANVCIACVVMWFTVDWRPKWVFNIKRTRVLFGYGWKLLVSGLLDTLYQEVRSLVIGKKYDSGTLGYYNRGKQFPQMFITTIDAAVKAVLLPAFSKKQSEQEKVKAMMRKSVVLSTYIIFPMMAGLAAVAAPLVSLLLTDKWLPCVPYLQIYCFTLAFHPVHSCNLQAINAMGRSDIFLKLEVIKKTMGVTVLIFAVYCFDSPIAIALTGVVTSVVNCFVNANPNKKLIGYSYAEQMKDILPSFLMSVLMFAAVSATGMLQLTPFVKLLVQIPVGVVFYIGVSAVTKADPFMQLMEAVGSKLKKK